MHYTTLLPLALFALPSLSAPAFFHSRAATSESWTITSLKTHFMGTNSGLPGGSWPPNTGFNSTVSFTVTLAPNTSTTCSTNWTAPNYPTAYLPCTESSVVFQLSAPAGGNFSEANFELDVQRTEIDSFSQTTTTYTAGQLITANDPSNPDSYLTCLGSAPLTGITCNQNGQLSVRTPLVLVASAATRN